MPFNALPAAHHPAAVPALLAGNILAQGTAQYARERETPSMNGVLRTVTRDQEIYGEDAKAEHFFKVVSGVVRLCKFLNDGRRQVISFHAAGDVFGVETGAVYRLSAEAVSDCTLIAYRRRNLETVVAGNDDIARQMFLYAMRNAAQAQEHTLLLGRRNAVEKVICFLLDWARDARNGAIVALEMSRQDMADYLGLTIETVSRTLSKLERDGIIELATSRNIRIKNLAALRANVA